MNVILEILLAGGDLLFEVGSVAHEMYFMSRGALTYFGHGGTHHVQYVDVGSWICEAVLWIQWVHRGTAHAERECTVISIDSAKMRSAVLEHRERSHVSRCATAYLKDLNAILHRGEVVNDMTKVTDDASSAYMEAINGE
mmetsp:Transcript_138838/g.245320  ORF Transcript_138838/g.245320 Transcript_138838/m.245320 type:complete len:140 (-) Transcript_138838:137-556(-)